MPEEAGNQAKPEAATPQEPSPPSAQEQLKQLVVETFGEKILVSGLCQDGKPFVRVRAGDLLEVCRALRDDERFAFDTLHCVTGVDRGEELESVNHLSSLKKKHWIVVKVRVPRESPEIPSLCSIWPGADWLEREQYDLFGIVYTNHPDLRRILLPDYWPGHPLRKDWVEPDYKELTRLTIEGAWDT